MSTPTITHDGSPVLPAPIVGKPGYKTSEFAVAAVVTVLIVGSVIAAAITQDQTLLALVKVADPSGGLLAGVYAIARSVNKNGVIKGLALQHAALSAAGKEVVQVVETVDPATQPAIDGLEARMTAMEQRSVEATGVDPSVLFRLAAVEQRFAPIAPAVQPETVSSPPVDLNTTAQSLP